MSLEELQSFYTFTTQLKNLYVVYYTFLENDGGRTTNLLQYRLPKKMLDQYSDHNDQ